MTASNHIPTQETAHTAEIARLNDATRSGTLKNSRMVMTRAVAEILGGDSTNDAQRAADRIVNMICLRQAILEAPIDPGNDPYGERDFGALDFMDQRILWKIDCYANDGHFTSGSDTPWDEAATFRIMTVMLAGEY